MAPTSPRPPRPTTPFGSSLIALLVLTGGCTPDPEPADAKGSDPVSDTAPATVDTSTAVDTATTSGGCPPYVGLEPSVVVLSPGFGDLEMPLAVREDGKGILSTLVTHPDLPGKVTLRVDDLLPGAYPVEELWDGASTIGSDDWLITSSFLPVKDQNGDGIEDYWVGHDLVAGPLLGRDASTNTVIATANSADGQVVAVGFDADGDGIDDLVQGGGLTAYIRYGPFVGELPSAVEGDADRLSYTILGAQSVSSATVLPGQYEGRSGILLSGHWRGESYAYVLDQPRGATVSFEDREAGYITDDKIPPPIVADLGDVDGDGQRDYLFGWGNQEAARGPLRYEDFSGRGAEPFELAFDSEPDEQVVRDVIGDLNGDGIMELIALQTFERDTPEVGKDNWWPVVAFSPYTDALDLSCALPLSYQGEPATFLSKEPTDADLDGDGLVDLVMLHHRTSDILIWWGRDLVDGHAALQR